jgi:protein involved in sex pheromone biosynthesis
MKRYIPAALGGLAAVILLSGCTSAADQANENLSKAAENFEVPRRIVGINGITDKVLFSVEGFCSIENDGRKLDVICKVDKGGTIERTTLGLSDNVTYVSTQLSGIKVDLFRPRIIFRPETIVPNIDLSVS